MRIKAIALCGLLLVTAGINIGCKERLSSGRAFADDTDNGARKWNGRDCFFGSSMAGIKRMNYLSLGFRYELKASDRTPFAGRPSWLKPALVEGMKQITGRDFASAEEVLNSVDDKTVWYQPVTNHLDPAAFPINLVTPGTPNASVGFYYFEVSLGDNWNGFVVQADRLRGIPDRTAVRPFKIVNKYSDGDTYDCAIARPTADQRRGAEMPVRLCAFGEDTGYLSSSLARRNGVWRSVAPVVFLKSDTTLTELQKKEILEGLDDFGAPAGQNTVSDLINATDDDEVGYQEIKYSRTGKVFRWYSYYSGDNPHGFIYGEGLTGGVRKVASIGDGSIDTCFVKKIR